MADGPLSGFTAVTVPAGTDEFAVNQAGTSKKMTLAQINAYAEPVSVAAVANQTTISGNGDVYVVNSGIAIPQTRLQAGSFVRWKIHASKTAAGTGTPVVTIRHGTGRATTDTARCAITCGAQAATANAGAIFEVLATFRTVGATTTATLQGGVGGSVAGFHTIGGQVLSSGFDSTVASTFIGLSINPGVSAVWTVYQVQADLLNIT